MGKDWKAIEIEKNIIFTLIRSNNLGCLWALDEGNDVFINFIIYSNIFYK